MISLVLVDHPGSGAPDFKALIAIAAASNKSLSNEYGEAYNRAVSFRFGDAKDLQPGDRMLGLLRDPSQPGDLGLHLPDGSGEVYPLLDAQDGVELSTTIDHEAKELVNDLECNLARQGSDGRFYAEESCDPVEQGRYQVDGVWLSNWVTPSWYSGIGAKYDHLGTLKAPLTVDVGGYAQWLDPAKGWQMVTHADKAPRRYRQMVPGRTTRRRIR